MLGDRNLLLETQHCSVCTVSKMNKEQQISEMMKLPNLRKVPAERLVNAPDMLRELGAKEVYLQLFKRRDGVKHCVLVFFMCLRVLSQGRSGMKFQIRKRMILRSFRRRCGEVFRGIKKGETNDYLSVLNYK